MRGTFAYGGTALLALAALVLGIGSLLGDDSRTGLAVAAAVAWVVQVVSFAALSALRRTTKGFLAAWAGGTVARMMVILVAAWFVTRQPGLPPAPTLLGLAGFFFGLLLIEPLFLEERTDAAEAA